MSHNWEKIQFGYGKDSGTGFLWRKRSSSLCSLFFDLVVVQAKRKQGSYLFLYNLGEESKEKEEKKSKKEDKKSKLEEKESRYGTPLKINSLWFVLLVIVIWFVVLV